jgi:hypothetical protein
LEQWLQLYICLAFCADKTENLISRSRHEL